MHNYRKYLNNSDFDKKWGFYVTTVGSTSARPNKDYPNNQGHPADHILTWDKGRILNGFYIVFITKGEGVLETEKTASCTIKAGTCFLLFPGIWHRYKPDSHIGWEEYWVGFNGNYPSELIKNGIFSIEHPFIEVGLNEKLLLLFKELIGTVQTAEPGYAQAAAGITLLLLGQISAESKYHTIAKSGENKMMAKAKFMLQESIDNPINLEEMVKDLPMSYSKFRKIFKSNFGISPNQYHLNLRLDKANELLLNTNFSVQEIALHTGFESIHYFSRLFKKKNGLAPTTYRERNFNHSIK